ncbi:hypothetical protein D3870_16810 [Noviherbaspirillum cavernae]|uniref:Uncharacterized protein n=1 Tax=Noviherbaspirillum cavernae TaxID=2320862 RepID=A0A418X4R4_9BURK|nr:hypothetical protein D3870_16810 [Noviherbaspirillum cavernae]
MMGRLIVKGGECIPVDAHCAVQPETKRLQQAHIIPAIPRVRFRRTMRQGKRVLHNNQFSWLRAMQRI